MARQKSSGRTLNTVKRSLQFFWISPLVLLAVCVWQIARLKSLIAQSRAVTVDSLVTKRYEHARASLSAEKRVVTGLEQAVLGQDETEFVS